MDMFVPFYGVAYANCLSTYYARTACEVLETLRLLVDHPVVVW
jgi:hypothetical protein